MGHKVHPTSFRLGNLYTWKSRWFAKPVEYGRVVLEDFQLRSYLNKKLANAGLVETNIERSLTKVKVTINVSRPGVVIGKGGVNLEAIKKELEQILNNHKMKKDLVRVELKVEEVKHPDLSARLVAERIVGQLVNRYPHRRAVSQAIEKVMNAGARGVKIQLAGRVGGAEISRTEKYFQGRVPTQTLRADIDYYELPALTKSGYVGIKVWICRGEVI